MFTSILLTLFAVFTAIIFLKTLCLAFTYLAFQVWDMLIASSVFALVFGAITSGLIYFAWCR